MVSKELILELQEIIKDEYNEQLTYEEAEVMAVSLVRYFGTLKEAYLACKKQKI